MNFTPCYRDVVIRHGHNYGWQLNEHMVNYWIAKNIIKVVETDAPVKDSRYQATFGDYDLDCMVGYGSSEQIAIDELLYWMNDKGVY